MVDPFRIKQIEIWFDWYVVNLEDSAEFKMTPFQVFSMGTQYTQLVAAVGVSTEDIEAFTRNAFAAGKKKAEALRPDEQF